MKRYLSKVLSLTLVLAMLASMFCLPASAALIKEGTNGKTVYLSTKATATKDGEEVSSVAAGSDFWLEVNFANNPTVLADSVQGYDLFLGYDSTKMTPQQKLNGATSPTTNLSYSSDIVKMSWASEEGIVDNDTGDIMSSGTLAYIKLKATTDLTAVDLASFTFPATGAGSEIAKMGTFSLVQTPALEVSLASGTYYDTTTAAELKEKLTVQSIDATGTKTAVNDFTVALPDGGLKVGDNNVTVTASGISETVKVTAVKDTVSSIAVTTDPTTMSYTSGDKLNLTGLVVTATYESGKEKAITSYTTKVNGTTVTNNTALTVADFDGKKITVEAEGKTAETTALTVSKKSVTVPTAAQSIVIYNGQEQTLELANNGDAAYYTVSGDKQTNAGNYEAIVSLNDETETQWATTFDGKISWRIAKANPTANLFTFAEPSSLTYDGKAKEATVEPKNGITGIGSVTVYYSSDGGSTYSEEKPVAVGTYRVRIAVDEDENYSNATITNDSWKFTITKATASYTAPTAKTGLEYSSSEQALIEAGNVTSAGAHMEYKLGDDAYTANAAEIKATAAGTYTVYYKVVGGDNFEDVTERSFTVTIAPKKLTKPTVDSTKTYTYSGEAQTVVLVGFEEATMEISGNTQTNASTQHKATVSLKNTTNYTWADNSTADIELPWTIAPKTVNVTKGTFAVTKTYDGTTSAGEATGTLALDGVIGGDTVPVGYTAIGDYSDANVGGSLGVEISGLSLSGGDAGNYQLAGTTATLAVGEITRATPTVGHLAVSDTSKVYNGLAQKPTVVLKSDYTGMGTITVNTSATNVSEGAKTITVTIAEGENFAAAEITSGLGTFSITPKSIADVAIEGIDNNGYEYTGSAITPTITVKDGGTTLEKNTDYTLSYTDNVNVGISAKITVTGQGNYDSATSKEVAFKITKKQPVKDTDYTVVLPTLPTYNGQEKSAVAAKIDGHEIGAITVKYNGETTKPKNVGTYTVTVDIAASDNFAAMTNVDCGEFTITAAPLTITSVTVAEKKYNGETDDADVTAVEFGGVVSGETLALGTDFTVSAAYDSADASESAAVTGTVTLADTAKAKNYSLANDGTFNTTGKVARATTTLSLTATNTTYTGAAYAGKITATANPDGSTVTYTYYTNEGCTTPTTGTNSGASSEGAAPVNAGTYYVKGVIEETTNYDAAEATASFTIAPKTLTVNDGTLVATKVFDDTTDAPMPEGALGLTGVYDSDAVSVTYTGVGTYADKNVEDNKSITLSGLELNGDDEANYTLGDVSEYTFTQASITVLSVTKPTEDATSYTYDGTEKTYTLGTTTDEEWYTVTNNARTNAGSQQVSVALKDTANTQWADATTDDLKFTFEIGKAQSTGISASPAKKTLISSNIYQTQQNTTYDLSTLSFTGVTAPCTMGAVTYAVADSGTSGYISVTNVTDSTVSLSYTPQVTTVTDGKFVIKVSCDNYADFTIEVPVEFKDKTDVSDKMTLTVPENLVYGTTYEITGKLNNVEKEFEYSYRKSGTSDAFTNDLPTNAGTYEIVASYNDDVVENDIPGHVGTKTATLTINPKSVADANVTIDDITALEYDGTPKQPTLTVEFGDKTLASGTDYTVAYTNNTNAGTAKATITGKGNYSDTKDKTFTINPKAITPTIEVTGTYTYNGSAQTPAYTVKNGEIPLTLNTDYTEQITNNTNAGTATVTVTCEGNYSGTNTANFEIGKKTVTVSGITAVGRAYNNGTSVTLDYTNAVFDGKLDGDTLTVTATGTLENADAGENKNVTLSNLVLGGTSVGNYVLAQSGNQTETTVTITKAAASYTAPTANTGLVYSGAEQALVNAGTSSHGTFTYCLTEDGGYSAAIPMGKNADTYTVYYKFTGDTNHSDASGSVSVTIGKKTVTVPSADSTDFTYTGVEQTYAVAANSDYTVTGDKQTNAGSYEVTVALADAANTEWATEFSGKFGWTIAPLPAVLTWAQTDSFVYDNTAKTVTAEVFNKKGSDTFSLTYENNSKTAVGNYTAKVTGLGNTNYTLEGATGAIKDWSITKANQTALSFTSGVENKTYGNEAFDVVVGGGSGTGAYSVTSSDTDVLTVAAKTGTTNTFTVTIVGKGDAALTVNKDGDNDHEPASAVTSATITVAQRTAALAWQNHATRDYDGNASNVTATVSNLVSGDECTVTVDNGTQTNAGTYTATATGLSNSNYTLPATGLTQSYTINKADYANVEKTASAGLRAAQNSTAVITLPAIPDGASYGTVTNDAGNFFTLSAISGNTLTATSKGTEKTAPETFTVAVNPDGNHNDYYITVTVTPTYKTVVTINAEDDGFTYGTTGKTGYKNLSVTSNFVATNTLLVSYEGVAPTVYEASSSVPTQAGTYKVTFTVPDSNENYTGNGSVNFTIAQKSVTAVADGLVVSKVYDGGTTAGTITSGALALSGVVDGDDVTVSGTIGAYASADFGTGINVTITNLTLGGADAGNYVLSATSGTFAVGKITKSAQEALNFASGIADKSYGDAAFDVVVGGGSGTGAYSVTSSNTNVLTVAQKDSTTFTVTVVGVGEATLTVSRAGDDNYEDAAPVTSATITVSKGTRTITGLSACDLYPNSTSLTLAPAVSKGGDDVSYTYESKNPGVVSVDANGKLTAVGDGTATVTVTAKGENYEDASADVTINCWLTLVTGATATAGGDTLSASVVGDKIVVSGLKTAGASVTVVPTLAGAGKFAYSTKSGTIEVSLSGSSAVLATYTIDLSGVTDKVEGVTIDVSDPTPTATSTVTGSAAMAATAAMEKADTKAEGIANSAAAALQDAAKQQLGGDVEEVNVEVEVAMTATELVVSGAESVFTVDITPTYTVTDADTGDALIENEKVPEDFFTAPVTVSVALPAGFPTENLVAKHTKDDGTVEWLKVTVKDGVASWQQSSFSEVSLVVDTRVAEILFQYNDLTTEVRRYVASDIGSAFPTDSQSGKTFSGWAFDVEPGKTFLKLEDELLKKLAAKFADANTAVGAEPVFTTSGGSSGGGGSAAKTYEISVDNARNGKVSVSANKAKKGDTVTITVTPDKGFTLETLTVLDKNGREITVKNLGSNKYSFKMPEGKVTVEATFMEDNTMLNFFVDVKATDYYYDAVLWAAENEITSGTDAVHFSPDAACTRGQVVTFLWRAAGCPVVNYWMNMDDVKSGEYYTEAVRWALSEGITKGTSATMFSPDATVNRAQVVTFLFRAAKAAADETSVQFADVDSTAYYADAVAWAVANDITNGTSDTTFSPNANCTRGQIVTFLYRHFVK